MLNHIYIRDLATIEELNLTLHHNNTMITGETGAGKSVFIEAIELALGGRASSNLIRNQKDKAEIALSFDISNFKNVIAKYKWSKGAIQFPLDKPLPINLIKKIVKYKLKENEGKAALVKSIKK